MVNTPEILSEYLKSVFFGSPDATLDTDKLDKAYVPFGEGLAFFAQCLIEHNQFAKSLSEGNLNAALPARKNATTDSLKSLHASLKHLTWQTQQVASGDYSQRIDFMGDFSIAFNTMVEQLADRQKKLELANFGLQETVIELQNAVLSTMAELIDTRDTNTGGHIDRTQKYLNTLLTLVQEKGLYEEETSTWNYDFLLPSAQLHDVGKIAVSDHILKKPGKLTEEEFEQIKLHTTYGKGTIDKIKQSTSEHTFLDYAGVFAVSHHEKWDGSGYPYGLKGEEIPLLGRLLAVVDVYDALTSERPYKEPFSHDVAIEIIKDSSGSHFDPQIAMLFVENEALF